ncbi:MAG: CehA/McbA family metallohydrolase [Archaeoglobaceae archaeon]
MLKAELHVHSRYSDGLDSVEKLVREAIKKGIEIISITDHDTLNGSLSAIELVEAEKLEIIVIPGIEVSTRSGHLLAYGIFREIEANLSMKETCKRVKEIGGISVLAHPFDLLRNGTIRVSDFKFADCIEVFNAKNYFNFLANFFAKRFKKHGIGGSDAHCAKHLGLVINYLESVDKSAILNALFDGKRQGFIERVSFLLSRINRKL